MAPHITHWTINDIEEVRRMAALGYTAMQIAQNFAGRSRNSVIGLCHRQKISLQNRCLPVPENKKNRARQQPSKPSLFKFKVSPITGSKHFIHGESTKTLVSLPPTPIKEIDPLPNKVWGSVSFRDLSNGIIRQCRFIEGHPKGLETMYCGEPVVQGKSWCADHMQLLYNSRDNGKAQRV